MPSMVGIVNRASDVPLKTKKYDVFLSVFLSRFGMAKIVITETLWSSIIFKTIMASLHRGRFVVVHLCSSFSIDPQNFSQGANFYQKLQFLAIFGAVWPHFINYNGKIWHEGAVLGLPPQTEFCKNHFRILISSCLFFLSRFGTMKFVITETPWSSVIFKTIMVPLHRGRFVVVHLYSTFFCGPHNFPLGANLYQ